jgi:DNA-binding beta-propeller fold protein YncE
MKNSFSRHLVSMLFALSLMLVSCKPEPPVTAPSDYSNGIYVVNEGNFGSSNSSVTFNNRSPIGIEIPFSTINNRPLGDVANSIKEMFGKVFVVVNNSGKIEVCDPVTFETEMTITELTSPRYAIPISSTQFAVTDWGTNTVNIFNIADFSLATSIPTGLGPEQMVFDNGVLYVANSGGFGLDNTITVVTLGSTITYVNYPVDDAPMQLQIDAYGKLWVLCRGDYGNFSDPLDDTPGTLRRIDPTTMTTELTITFSVGDHPARMAINETGTTIYYLNGMMYKADVLTTGTVDLFSSRYFYGLGVDGSTGKIYVTDAGDFQQRGWAIRYNPDGTAIDSFRTGIIPGDFAF